MIKFNNIGKRRTATVFIHVTCVFMLFLLPELMMSLSRNWAEDNVSFRWGMYFKALVYVGVFYANYFFIVGNTLGKPRGHWRFMAYNALLVVLALCMIHFWWQMVSDSRPWPHHARRIAHQAHYMRLASVTLRDLVMIILTISLAVAVRLSDKWLRLERRTQAMTAARREVELRSLRSQLNPHFLFNTLNTIYALVEVDSEAAQKAVHRLSSLLRHVLYDNPETTTLDSELDFVRDYVSLMQLRLSKTPIRAELDAATHGGRRVPPLLFVPLIENAFKYGNTGNPLHEIFISVTANEEGVECRTVNHFEELPADCAGGEGGIGLVNLCRRLQLIYGDAAMLDIGSEAGVYTTCMRIPFVNNLLS